MAYKSVQFKVFAPGCRSSQLFKMTMPGKTKYSKAQVEVCKQHFTVFVEESFPFAKFTMIPVGPNKFNLIPGCANA